MARQDIIPNQVFIGLPWKNVKKRYENVVDRIKITSPISWVIVGREDDQDAEDLLAVIKGKLESSSHAIFDATWGNANVSLEYGYAEAKNIPRALYVSTHKATRKTKDNAIISDLAGKRRNSYATTQGLLDLMVQFSKRHPYTQRFENVLRREFRTHNKGKKKRSRSLALKVIHQLDNQADVRREDLVNALLADPVGYRQVEIEEMIRKLHNGNLIYVERGRYSRVSIA